MKKRKEVIPILVVIILILIITGYRFTALSAAKSNSFVSRDFEVIEKYDTGSSVIFLFKSDEKELFLTVLSEKSGLFYRSNLSTYIPYSSDTLQTVGGLSFTTNSEAFSFISIQSYDDEVAYIEAGEDSNLERKEINKGERIYFLFPFSKQIDFLNATAFNKDGKKLYYYGYPKETNIINGMDLNWHKVDEL
jgi:hypothetical protein